MLGRSPGEENGNLLQYSCLEKFSIEMLNYNGSSVTLNHAIKTFVGTSLRVQFWASQVTQTAKRLPTMWETQVRSLGWEDPLEKEIATHSSVLAWRIPGTEEPSGLLSMGSHRVGHD